MLGQAAFGFLVPALAGDIAYAIADRPGIVPGFVVGAVSLIVGAGLLGGVVGGVIAGFAAKWTAGWALPAFARGLPPVVIIALLATLISSGLMVALLGQPLAKALTGLGDFLTGLSGGSIVLLGVILGLMMCFDLGGPVNKAAYVFATTGIGVTEPSPANLQIMAMAMVMGAGMVPPLAMAMSTAMRARLYTPAERDNGLAARRRVRLRGCDPLRRGGPAVVIPSMMLGGATTGALVGAFGTELRAPHGGVFVFFAMTQAALSVIAVLIDAAVGAVAVTVAKSVGRRPGGTPGAASEKAMAGAPASTGSAARATS